MFENNKIRLLVIVLVVSVGIFVVMGKSETSITKKVLKIEPLEASTIVESSKDFYKVCTKEMNSLKRNTIAKKSIANKANTLIDIMNLKDANMTLLDKSILSFMTDKHTSRLDKINALWGLLGEVGLDSFKGEYLLDALVILHPIELTEELISAYDENIKTRIKLKIITMLSENASILNPEVQSEKELAFIVENIKNVQIFLKEKILTNTNSDIVSAGLNAYANIADIEEVQEVIETLMQGDHKSLVQQEKLVSLQTEMALSTKETQEEMLPSMLHTMQNKNTNPKEQEAFTNTLIKGLNSGVLTSVDTEEVSAYLEKQEPSLALSQGFSPQKLSKYYDWAKASANIKDSDIDLARIALENDNPLKVSSILFYADKKTIQKIKENPNAQSIYMKLELALKEDSLNQYTKQVFRDAIEVLKENNIRR